VWLGVTSKPDEPKRWLRARGGWRRGSHLPPVAAAPPRAHAR
jgi:hypothetical protein